MKEPQGETVAPELYLRELGTWVPLHAVEDGDEVFPGITRSHDARLHTG